MASKITVLKIDKRANARPEQAAAAANRAFSGAWGTHLDGRHKRARTRSTATKRAIRDSAQG
jgi:hypothetical protein